MITLITSGTVALSEPVAPLSIQPAMFARDIEELAPMDILDACRTIEPQWMRDRLNAQIEQSVQSQRVVPCIRNPAVLNVHSRTSMLACPI